MGWQAPRRGSTARAMKQCGIACVQALSKKMLLKPGETRFATAYIMMERAYECKQPLQQLVVSEAWTNMVSRLPPAARQEADAIKANVLDDKKFWKDVHTAMEVCQPIYQLLRLVDGNQPCAGKVYYYCAKVEKAIANSETLDASDKQ